MFWHVYLFNLFILTSSDYNWQQWAELTLDSVLGLSVTITQKAHEGKFSKEVTTESWVQLHSGFANGCWIQTEQCWKYTLLLTSVIRDKSLKQLRTSLKARKFLACCWESSNQIPTEIDGRTSKATGFGSELCHEYCSSRIVPSPCDVRYTCTHKHCGL